MYAAADLSDAGCGTSPAAASGDWSTLPEYARSRSNVQAPRMGNVQLKRCVKSGFTVYIHQDQRELAYHAILGGIRH